MYGNKKRHARARVETLIVDDAITTHCRGQWLILMRFRAVIRETQFISVSRNRVTGRQMDFWLIEFGLALTEYKIQ